MDFKLDHVAIFTSDFNRSVAAYKTLGLETTLDMFNKDNFHFVFLGNGNGYQIQLEPPQRLYDYEHEWQAKHGATWNHFCAFVDDCALAEKHFLKEKVNVIFPTSKVLFVDSLVAVDEEDINIELLAYNDQIRFGDMDRTRPMADYELSLQQISFLTKDPQKTADYYQRIMGFRKVEERTDGSVFITDNHHNHSDNDMLIKLSPTSNLLPFQKEYYARHGTAIDHIVFVAKDPKTAWMKAVAKEKLLPGKAPEYDEREGCIAGWLIDPDGNYIMIREPYIVK
jgi:catechol 2,3-dioxygenase-like lactoylglutathione lyase family enzyme